MDWLHVPPRGAPGVAIETGTLLGGAVAWGAATGLGFLVALVVVLVAAGSAAGGFFLLIPFGAMFAAAIGAVVGFLCGLLDFFLLALAALLSRRRPPPRIDPVAGPRREG